MLYEFKNYNKHGNVRTRIIPGVKGKAFSVNPKGLGSYIGVRVLDMNTNMNYYPQVY